METSMSLKCWQNTRWLKHFQGLDNFKELDTENLSLDREGGKLYSRACDMDTWKTQSSTAYLLAMTILNTLI